MPNTTPGVFQIETYHELQAFAEAFAQGHYTLMTVIGGPGLAKTRTIRDRLADQRHLHLGSHVTPFSLYASLYQHRDLPVILDDVDSLIANRTTIPILKAACDLEPVRELMWSSSHARIGHGPGQIPPTFTTTSPICLLANGWAGKQCDLPAIWDRSLVLHFEPGFEEIHNQAGLWFDDHEVYRFIGENVALADRLSLRTYVKAKALRASFPTAWKPRVLELLGIDARSRMILSIMDDPSISSDQDRVQAFIQAGLGSRATYYRAKARMADPPQSSLKVSPDSECADPDDHGPVPRLVRPPLR